MTNSNPPNVVIFNGPPGSGKDTVADHLALKLGLPKVEFKEALINDAARLGNRDLAAFRQLCAEGVKDTHQLGYLPFGKSGCTPRQWLIYVSETLMKPFFGLDYYGKQMVLRLQALNTHTYFCSDGGFQSEVDILRHHGYKVTVIQLERPGHDFASDSRTYIEGDVTLRVKNDSSKEDLYKRILGILYTDGIL